MLFGVISAYKLPQITSSENYIGDQCPVCLGSPPQVIFPTEADFQTFKRFGRTSGPKTKVLVQRGVTKQGFGSAPRRKIIKNTPLTLVIFWLISYQKRNAER